MFALVLLPILLSGAFALFGGFASGGPGGDEAEDENRIVEGGGGRDSVQGG
jgi:hypothetical protein